MNGQIVGHLVIGRRRPRMKMKTPEVEDVLIAKRIDQVAEDIAGERCMFRHGIASTELPGARRLGNRVSAALSGSRDPVVSASLVLMTYDDGGIAGHDRARRHVPGHYRAGTYHCQTSDGQAGQNGGIGADRSPVLDNGHQELERLPRSGKHIVGECDVGADKDAVAKTYAVANLDAPLYRHLVAKDHIVLDEDIVADIAAAPDAGVWKHMREGPYAGAGTDASALADRPIMDEHLFQTCR